MSLSFQVHAIHFDNDDHGVGHSVGDVSCISGHYSNEFRGELYFENAGENFESFGSEIPENFLPVKLKAVYLDSGEMISKPKSSAFTGHPGAIKTFRNYFSNSLGFYTGPYDGTTPEGYDPVEFTIYYGQEAIDKASPNEVVATPDPTVPEPTVPEPTVPEPIVSEPTPEPIVSEPTSEPTVPEPTPNNGGSSSGGGALVAIVVVGAVILAMNNRTAIKNSFFLDEKGMGFDLNKYGKLRMNSYLPNKYVSVGILSWDVGLSKSINFGLRSTLVSTGQQRFNASLAYSF